MAPSQFQGPRMFADNEWLLEGTGAPVLTIAPFSLTEIQQEVTRPSRLDILCTYTLVEGEPSRIYVPGCPPRWDPPARPKWIPADTGLKVLDKHALRNPAFPFEPSFAALGALNPTCRLNDTDIVVSKDSLLWLFDFVAGKVGRQLRYDLHMVHKTLFISRREKSTTTEHEADSFSNSVPLEFTIDHEDLPYADGHFRLLKYKFGHLNLVVRVEVDAYYADGHEDKDGPEEHSTLSSLDPLPQQSAQPTELIISGELIPHTRCMWLGASKEIGNKSRNAVEIALPNLWFGQMRVSGIHARTMGNLFYSGGPQSIKEQRIRQWEEEQQSNLRKLAGLLDRLKATTEHTQDGAAVLVQQGEHAPLQVFQAEQSNGALPEHIIKQFWE